MNLRLVDVDELNKLKDGIINNLKEKNLPSGNIEMLSSVLNSICNYVDGFVAIESGPNHNPSAIQDKLNKFRSGELVLNADCTELISPLKSNSGIH